MLVFRDGRTLGSISGGCLEAEASGTAIAAATGRSAREASPEVRHRTGTLVGRAVGSVAMARRSDKVNPKHDSDGTQFYFGLGNMSALNGSYTVFGQVVSGLDVVKRISHAVTDSNDCPVARIEIKDVKISEQKGPLFSMITTPHGNTRQSKPDALKGSLEKFIERIW